MTSTDVGSKVIKGQLDHVCKESNITVVEKVGDHEISWDPLTKNTLFVQVEFYQNVFIFGQQQEFYTFQWPVQVPNKILHCKEGH